MTLLNVDLTTPAADGSLTAAKGVLRFTPTARFTVDDTVVLPAPFQVPLVLGLADVELEPSTGAWVWQVDEHIAGVRARTIYAQVPDVLEVAYKDLVAIDPVTLEPSPTPDPAWVAPALLDAARDPEALFTGVITRDANGAPTASSVIWPDGVTGTYAGVASATWPGAVDSYTITHGTTTYTQPLVTRNSSGQITTRPAITV